MPPPRPRSGPRPASHGPQAAARSYGFTPALVGRALLAPSPPPPDPLAQHQARAAARYHERLRVTELAPGIRPFVARQDGPLAYQAQAGARAARQYHVALTTYHTRQALLARQTQDLWEGLGHPAAPTTFVGPAEQRIEIEEQAHQRQVTLFRARQKYIENVALISGEFTPLVLVDPVSKATAQAGLIVMGSVAVGAGVATMPAGLRWMGTGWEAFSSSPWQVVGAVTTRGALDAAGQYGAGLILHKGYQGSFDEINWVESGMAAGNMNPYFIAVGSAGVSLSRKDRLQSIFHSEASGHNISNAKFFTQAAVGLSIGHFGSKFEHRLAANHYKAWRTVALASLMNTPRWGQPAVGAGLRWGQEYGTPLMLGVVEETNEGLFGDGADKWWKNPNNRAETPLPQPVDTQPHPDSPVFLNNVPKP